MKGAKKVKNKQDETKKSFKINHPFIVYFVVVFMLLAILEALKVYQNFSSFRVIRIGVRIIEAICFGVIFKECVKQDIAENKKVAPSKQGVILILFDNAGKFVVRLFKMFLHSGFVSIVLILAFTVGIATYAAEERIIGKAVALIVDFRYSEDENEIPPLEESSLLDLPNNEDVVIDESTSEISIHPDSNASAFLADPDRKFILSEEEYNKLYFINGTVVIDYSSDSNSIAEVLADYIFSLQQQSKDNYFDKFAPQTLCNDVAYASELETKMVTSEDLDTIIFIRSNAWEQYPKLTLAKLLAANHQRYALEYEEIGAEFSTIEYYYAQSIFWLLESLTFKDLDNYTKKVMLSSLEMRYRDIAAIAPKGSLNKRYSQVLSEAFGIVKNL